MLLLSKKPTNQKDYLDMAFFNSVAEAIAYVQQLGDVYAIGPHGIVTDREGNVYFVTPKANYRVVSTDFVPTLDWKVAGSYADSNT